MERAFLQEIECPVCLLTPRQPPIHICPLGHSVCCECRPKISKCPICKVKYLTNRDTRNFFAEKILDSLRRKCRYELFGCDYSVCDSRELVDHELMCIKKPDVMIDEKKGDQSEDSDGENIEVEEDFINNIENEPIFLNLIYFYDIRPLFHFYAFTTVFLRMFLAEFGDISRHPQFKFEVFFLVLILVWLLARLSKGVRFFMEIYQPDEFETQFEVLRSHLRGLLYQDANEVYVGLVVWSMMVILGLVCLKLWVSFSDQDHEVSLSRFQAVMFFVKPMVTFLTSLVCVALHIFFKWGKMDKWAAVFGVFRLLWLSFNMAFVELSLSTGCLIDDGYRMIFWIQSVTVFLPLGKVSFILLELFGFLLMTYNAYDTLAMDGQGKQEVEDVFLKAFTHDYAATKLKLEGLRSNLEALKAGLSYIDNMFGDLGLMDMYNQSREEL